MNMCYKNPLTDKQGFSESLLSNLPGFIAYKEIRHHRSYLLWTNKSLASEVGFKNNDDLIGLRDDELKCDDVINAAPSIYKIDEQTVTENRSVKTLDVFHFNESGLIGLLGEKVPAQHENSAFPRILFQGLIIPKNILHQIHSTILDTNHKDIAFTGLYQIRDTIHELGLTRAETQCFFYYLRGQSAREIAERLHLSIRTIEDRIAIIKSKALVSSRSQLFDLAYTMGLLRILPEELMQIGCQTKKRHQSNEEK